MYFPTSNATVADPVVRKNPRVRTICKSLHIRRWLQR